MCDKMKMPYFDFFFHLIYFSTLSKVTVNQIIEKLFARENKITFKTDFKVRQFDNCKICKFNYTWQTSITVKNFKI